MLKMSQYVELIIFSVVEKGKLSYTKNPTAFWWIVFILGLFSLISHLQWKFLRSLE